MKLTELRQIIKEELEEARLPGKFKLIGNWKEKITTNPNLLSSTKQNLINKIESIIKNKQAEGAEDPTVMTRSDFGNQQEFQRYTTCKKKPNPIASNSEPILEEEDKEKYCKTEEEAKNHPLAILYFSEKTASTREPRVSSGIKGRPKVIDSSKKMIGLNIINKYAKGSIDFTPEEAEFIETLYKTIKA